MLPVSTSLAARLGHEGCWLGLEHPLHRAARHRIAIALVANDVEQQHRHAGIRHLRGDPRPHSARADDADSVDCVAHSAASSSVAMPCPPPMHWVASAYQRDAHLRTTDDPEVETLEAEARSAETVDMSLPRRPHLVVDAEELVAARRLLAVAVAQKDVGQVIEADEVDGVARIGGEEHRLEVRAFPDEHFRVTAFPDVDHVEIRITLQLVHDRDRTHHDENARTAGNEIGAPERDVEFGALTIADVQDRVEFLQDAIDAELQTERERVASRRRCPLRRWGNRGSCRRRGGGGRRRRLRDPERFAKRARGRAEIGHQLR